MNYKELTGKTIKESFYEFIKANPHVFQKYCELVKAKIDQGEKRIRTKGILDQMREMKIKSNDKNFRINDAFQSYFPREYVRLHKCHEKYFSFRKQRNEELGPYMHVDGDLITFAKAID